MADNSELEANKVTDTFLITLLPVVNGDHFTYRKTLRYFGICFADRLNGDINLPFFLIRCFKGHS